MDINISIAFTLRPATIELFGEKRISFGFSRRYIPSEADILEAFGLPEMDKDDYNEIIINQFRVFEHDDSKESIICLTLNENHWECESEINKIIALFDDTYIDDYSAIDISEGLDLNAFIKDLEKQLQRQEFIESADNQTAAELFLKEHPKYDAPEHYYKLKRKFSDIFMGMYTSEMDLVESIFGEVPEPDEYSIHSYIDWEALAEDLISQSDYSMCWSQYPDTVRIYLFDLSHVY